VLQVCRLSGLRTPCTPHDSVYPHVCSARLVYSSARRRRRYAQSNRHSSVEAISRRTSSQSFTHVSVYSARRRRRYAQSNRHSSVEAISRRTSSQSSTDAVYSARRRRRYAQSNRHSSVEAISRRTSSQSSTDAVYSARLRVLRTSTPPLRTVEPPFVCGGYQSSDVKSVVNGRRVLRTSPCTPHVDAAVTHSRTAIRLWRLSVVGRQVSRQRTPCTPHVSVYSARRRRRYAQSNRHSSVEAISRRTSSQSSTDAVYSARLRVLRTSTPPLRTVEPPFVCGGYQSSDVKSVINGRRVLRTSPCTPHVDAAVTHSRTAIRLWRLSVVGRQVSRLRTPCTVYSGRRVLRTSSDVSSFVLRTPSTPPLRTVEPPFVCGGYQSSDVKSVVNGRRVLRTSPCTPHVDAAVTHSRTAIRLWRLSVVGRQVSTPHVSVYSARRRRRYAQSNRHSSVEVISRRTVSRQQTPCTPRAGATVSIVSVGHSQPSTDAVCSTQSNYHSCVVDISR
jgi:rRNA maturation protein Rpf1